MAISTGIQLCVCSWIICQAACSQPQNATIYTNGDVIECSPENCSLNCQNHDTIVIDGLSYYGSNHGNQCHPEPNECPVSHETKYMIWERCSVRRDHCDLSGLNITAPSCTGTNTTASCIVVQYSCLSDNLLFDMCTNATEEGITELFLTLNKTQQNWSHNLCSCNVTTDSPPVALLARDVRFYDDLNMCSPTYLALVYHRLLEPDSYDLFYRCNNTLIGWPSSIFNEDLRNDSDYTEIRLHDVAFETYPGILLQIKGNFSITCATNGSRERPSTSQPTSSTTEATTLTTDEPSSTTEATTLTTDEPSSITDSTTLPIGGSTVNVTGARTPDDADDTTVNHMLTYILPAVGGLCLIIIGTLFTVILYRRRQNPNLQMDRAKLGEVNENTDARRNITQSQRTNVANTFIETVFNGTTEYAQVVKPKQKKHAYVNIQPDRKSGQLKVSKKAKESDQASNYDHITLSAGRPSAEDTNVYSYDHLVKEEDTYCTNHEINIDTSDETYDHLNGALAHVKEPHASPGDFSNYSHVALKVCGKVEPGRNDSESPIEQDDYDHIELVAKSPHGKAVKFIQSKPDPETKNSMTSNESTDIQAHGDVRYLTGQTSDRVSTHNYFILEPQSFGGENI